MYSFSGHLLRIASRDLGGGKRSAFTYAIAQRTRLRNRNGAESSYDCFCLILMNASLSSVKSCSFVRSRLADLDCNDYAKNQARESEERLVKKKKQTLQTQIHGLPSSYRKMERDQTIVVPNCVEARHGDYRRQTTQRHYVLFNGRKWHRFEAELKCR